MAKISIIVPVYNVEQYLEKCIDSILAQTFSEFEVLLVDDGSTDGSGAICDCYAEKDDRIRVFHKENGGLSSARNFGIDQAKTPYVTFIDSDDYIDPDMYELLYGNLLSQDADISICGFYNVYNGEITDRNETDELIIANSEGAIRTVMEARKLSVVAVGKLYKKELFDHVRYPIGKTAEDAFVIVELLMRAERIVMTTEQKYYYIHRKGSITTNKFKASDFNTIYAYKHNYGLIKTYYPDILDVAKMRLCWAHFYVLDKMMRTDAHDYHKAERQIIRYLKKHYVFIMKNDVFTRSRKIALTLLMIHPELYRVVSRIQAKRLDI